MSRFLEYGIFLPDAHGATRPPNPDGATGNASKGRWAKVGSKWMKVGPDGEPLVSVSSVPPSASSFSVSRDENNSRPTLTVPPTFSSTEDSNGGSIDPLAHPGGLEEDPSGKSYGHHVTRLAAALYENPAGSWETPPTTSSDCNDERQSSDSGTSPNRPTQEAVRGNRQRSACAGTAGDREAYKELDSWDVGSLGGENSTEGLRVDVPLESERGAEGSGPRSHLMLTPGISRTYSKDEIVHKFFGETNAGVAGEPTSDHGPGAANGGLRTRSESNVACVGERAKSKEEGRRIRRKGSSSNEKKPAVETRDVACQWDGSEMGDASDDEDMFPQVELPNTPDCTALTAVLRLYDHARLENKRTGVVSSRPGWGVEENIENWDGVYLDTDDRVVALDVDGDPENRQAVLIGPLPVELSLMDRLEQLTMRRHRFKGRIPAELGKLSRLTHLNLSKCRLIGFLPVEFGDLSSLVVLNVSWNFLSGDIPAELRRLTKLEELLLNSNAFSGAIPHEFGKLRSLQRFNAGHNIGLSGTLPPEMSRMSQLAVLDLRHNKIAGRIPPVFGRLANLEQLLLQDNQLNDEIPVELARLQKLKALNLSNNKLSGVVPLALRGHPRYMSFKILSGNFALGERVPPSAKEVEAASRRPSTDAMTHASVARAKAQQQAQLRVKQQQQQRPVSSSMSPSRDEAGRRRTTGADLSVFGEPTVDELKRRSAGNRNSFGLRVRSMKRIMGKKATPPVTPTRARSRAGTEDSTRSRSLSSASAPASTSPPYAQGKSFLEATTELDEGNETDGSPNPTASLSTGAGASVNASPSSHDGGEEQGHGLLGGVVRRGGGSGRGRGGGAPSLLRVA